MVDANALYPVFIASNYSHPTPLSSVAPDRLLPRVLTLLSNAAFSFLAQRYR